MIDALFFIAAYALFINSEQPYPLFSAIGVSIMMTLSNISSELKNKNKEKKGKSCE